MRKFKLQNKDGQELDLNKKDMFLSDPKGLGFGTETEVQKIGDTYITLKENQEKPQPSGTINFSGYEKLNEFKAFVRIGGLKLAYQNISEWRYLDCSISIEIGEIDKDGLLKGNIVFTALSAWYEEIVAFKSEVSTEGKRYPYTYPVKYSSADNGVITIKNGTLPSYFKIQIFGPVVNPSYTLFQNDLKVASGKYFVEIPIGEKLVINSNPKEMEIAQYSSENIFKTDRYNTSDFSTERLFKLPEGESRMVFNQEDIADVIAFVEVQKNV